jgi:hypothetical protein
MRAKEHRNGVERSSDRCSHRAVDWCLRRHHTSDLSRPASVPHSPNAVLRFRTRAFVRRLLWIKDGADQNRQRSQLGCSCQFRSLPLGTRREHNPTRVGQGFFFV